MKSELRWGYIGNLTMTFVSNSRFMIRLEMIPEIQTPN